jgi:hypothetical protein
MIAQHQHTINLIIESDVNYALLDDDENRSERDAHDEEDQLDDMLEKQEQQEQTKLKQSENDNDEEKLRITKQLNRTAFEAGSLSCFCLGMMLAYPYGLLMLVLHEQSSKNNGANGEASSAQEKSLSELVLWFQYFILDFTSYLPLLACILNLMIVCGVASRKGYKLVLALASSSSLNLFGSTFQEEENEDFNQERVLAMASYFGSGLVHGSLLSTFVVLVFMGAPFLPWPSD